MKTFISFIFSFICASAIYGQISLEKNDIVTLDRLCQDQFDKENFPGMAVMIAHKDSIIYSKGYGYANVENKTAIDPESSLFRIGSVSKTLTAAALGILIEEGKIDPDEKVQTYVPYFPEKKYPLTVRQVAGHIGGIRHYRGMEFMFNKDFNNVEEGVEIFNSDTLLFKPGSQYKYSSYGWNLLSAVVEGASDSEFRKYMEEKVFNVLSMHNTYPEHSSLDLETMVSYYQHDDKKQIKPAFQVNNSYKWAGGGFLSSAKDLIHFANGILNHKLYNESTQDLLWTTQHLDVGIPTNYGMGWSTNTDKYGNLWKGHSGGSVGGSSMFLMYPEYDLTIVTLINLSGAETNGLAYRLGEAILNKE